MSFADGVPFALQKYCIFAIPARGKAQNRSKPPASMRKCGYTKKQRPPHWATSAFTLYGYRADYFSSSMAACAAAKRAIGTRKGEQLA